MIPATPRHRQLKNNLAGIYGGMGGNPDKTIVTPVCNSELESPSTHRASVDGVCAEYTPLRANMQTNFYVSGQLDLGHVLPGLFWIIKTSKVPMAVTKDFIRTKVSTCRSVRQTGNGGG